MTPPLTAATQLLPVASPTSANSSVNFTEKLRKPKYILEMVHDFVHLDGNMKGYEGVKGINGGEKKI